MKTLHQLWREQDGPLRGAPAVGSSAVDVATKGLWAAVAALGLAAAFLVAHFLLFSCAIRGGQQVHAISSLRTISVSQSIYREEGRRVVGGATQYADSLAELSASGTDLIDDVLGSGRKDCYEFRVRAHPAGYNWDAEAHSTCTSCGSRRFYTNQSGVIYFSSESPDKPTPLSAGMGEVPDGFNALGG